MSQIEIDINCDLGESYGHFKVGNDAVIFPYISSCNIACGQHGGDPLTIEKTIQTAIQHYVQIGAHPSYPDLAGFGRRKMTLPHKELQALVKSQIAIVDGLTNSHGAKLKYVKPHGALYNSLAKDANEAEAFVSAIQSYNATLAIMGLPNSQLEKAAKRSAIRFIREGFIDRLYQPDGSLAPRDMPNAVYKNVEEMIQQFLKIVVEGKVATSNGKEIAMEVESLCIHGDNPHAEELLKALHKEAKRKNMLIKKVAL